MLIRLCRAPNRLFITADANQSIYGSSFRWSDVHQDLKLVGRTDIPYLNHRTTKEINAAAHADLADVKSIGLILDDRIRDEDFRPAHPMGEEAKLS